MAGPLIAIAVITLVTVVGNYLLPSRARRIDRQLAAIPPACVEEAHGTVRLTGRVRRDGELLRAPLSGRPCVAYEMFVDDFRSSNGPGTSNRCRRADARGASPFIVVDESGEARVDTSGPFLLALVHDRTGTTGFLDRYPGEHRELASFLEAAGLASTNWFGGWRAFTYAEGVLEEGEIVSVGGASAREVDPTGDSPNPRSPPERLVLRGTDALPLLISEERHSRNEPERSD